MRQVGLTDLHHAARAVQNMPKAERTGFCKVLLWRAHVADKYVKRLRKLHPAWGDGSLRTVAMAHGQANDHKFDAGDLLLCFAIVLECLSADDKQKVK